MNTTNLYKMVKINLRPQTNYLSLKERKKLSLEINIKNIESRKQRMLEFNENESKLDINNFEDYLWFLKYNSTNRDIDKDIEIIEPPLNYIDPFYK